MTPPSPATAVNYGYDLNNRLTSVSDGSAAIATAVPSSGPSVQYATNAAYDVLNRPFGISWSPASAAAVPPPGSVVAFSHTYNKANQRIGQTVTDNSWFNYPAATPSTVSYTADALNRYTAVGAVNPAAADKLLLAMTTGQVITQPPVSTRSDRPDRPAECHPPARSGPASPA